MKRKLTSLLLTLAVVITLALPYSVSAAELNEVLLTTESEQTNNEGITNPTLENTIEDTTFPKHESSSNPEDVTAEDPSGPEVPGDEGSNVPEVPGDKDTSAPEVPGGEDSNVPETPDSEDSNDADTPELPEDGSPETPSEDETGSGSSDTDNLENAESPVINEDPENGEGDLVDPSSVNAAASNIAYPQMTGYYLVSITGTAMNPNGSGKIDSHRGLQYV